MVSSRRSSYSLRMSPASSCLDISMTISFRSVAATVGDVRDVSLAKLAGSNHQHRKSAHSGPEWAWELARIAPLRNLPGPPTTLRRWFRLFIGVPLRGRVACSHLLDVRRFACAEVLR